MSKSEFVTLPIKISGEEFINKIKALSGDIPFDDFQYYRNVSETQPGNPLFADKDEILSKLEQQYPKIKQLAAKFSSKVDEIKAKYTTA